MVVNLLFYQLNNNIMKIIFLFLLLPFTMFLKEKNQSGAPCVTITATKMNMLYIGLDNPVTVTVDGYTDNQITVKIDGGGTIKPVGESQYVINPDGSKREISIITTIKTNDRGEQKAAEKIYRVRKVPHPEVLIGTRNGGTAALKDLENIHQINAGLGEGFAIEGLRYTVNSYTMIITHQESGNYIEDVNGNRISARTTDEFKNIKPGDYITVTNVDATGPAGKVMLGGTTLKVK
jgi:hypothetical protein